MEETRQCAAATDASRDSLGAEGLRGRLHTQGKGRASAGGQVSTGAGSRHGTTAAWRTARPHGHGPSPLRWWGTHWSSARSAWRARCTQTSCRLQEAGSAAGTAHAREGMRAAHGSRPHLGCTTAPRAWPLAAARTDGRRRLAGDGTLLQRDIEPALAGLEVSCRDGGGGRAAMSRRLPAVWPSACTKPCLAPLPSRPAPTHPWGRTQSQGQSRGRAPGWSQESCSLQAWLGGPGEGGVTQACKITAQRSTAW